MMWRSIPSCQNTATQRLDGQAGCVTLPGRDGWLHVRRPWGHIWRAGAAEVGLADGLVGCNSGEEGAKRAKQKQEVKAEAISAQ